MSMIDMMMADVQGILAVFGEPVIYTPPDGSPVSLTAIVDRGAKFTGNMNAVTWIAEIPMADLSQPEKGGLVTIGAQTFDVHDGDGQRINHDGVWWKIPLVYDERSGYRGRR